MKGILVIIDGLGDLPVPELDHRTPLEAARTPVLNAMAARGQYGLIDPIGPGILPNTHSGAGILLGMLPGQVEGLKRGPVEAAGLGLSLAPGDVALRANFATLVADSGGFRVLDRRAGRIREGSDELAAVINRIDPGQDVSVRFWPTEQHRGVLVLSGPALDARVTDTDPGDHGGGWWVASRPEAPAAELTAELINRFSAEVFQALSASPVNHQRAQSGQLAANGLLVRGAGHPMVLENQVTLHSLTASVVSGCNTVQGLGRLLGFTVVKDARFTADLDTDLPAKLSTALQELERSNVVFVHVKAPDLCAHDGDSRGKKNVLESIDTALEPLLHAGVAIAVASDHTTDSNTGRHTPDPVPALIWVPGCTEGETRALNFGETACRTGTLPRSNSHRFLLRFLRSGNL